MDSQERHELQENDLAEFFANFGEWWNKYGNVVLIAVMAVLLIGAGWRFINFRAATAHEEAWADLAFAVSPEGYRAVAEEHGPPAVQALAYLRGGDLLLGQALTNDPATATDADPTAADATGSADASMPQTPRDRESLLAGAQTMYQRALEVAPHEVYRLNALLGLAAVAESQQQWDAAEQRYQQVIDTAGQRFATLAEQARTRLDMLDELRQPVVFAPEPVAGEGQETLETLESQESQETQEAVRAPAASTSDE